MGIKCPPALVHYGKRTPEQGRVKFPPASQACLSRRPEKRNSEEKVQESEVGVVQGDLERGGLVQGVHKKTGQELTISQHLFNLHLTFKKTL